MAKEIKFRVKLSVDGKEQLVTATTNVKRLRSAFDDARTSSERLRGRIAKLSQVSVAFHNTISGLQ